MEWPRTIKTLLIIREIKMWSQGHLLLIGLKVLIMMTLLPTGQKHFVMPVQWASFVRLTRAIFNQNKKFFPQSHKLREIHKIIVHIYTIVVIIHMYFALPYTKKCDHIWEKRSYLWNIWSGISFVIMLLTKLKFSLILMQW